MLERSLKEENVSYRKIEFSSGQSLRKCLQNGLGVTICPDFAIEQELEDGSLKRLETTDIVNETPVLMIHHIDKWRSPLLQEFMTLTKRAFSN